MKYILTLLLALPLYSLAQQKAITENGEVVLLFEDGTWRYENGSVPAASVLEKNPYEFKKPATATFCSKSKKNDFCVWYNPKKWKPAPNKINSYTEYEFTNTASEVFCMMINEEIQIDLVNFKRIVMDNIIKEASSHEIIKEEYRSVNGHEVLFIELKATIQGLKFHYFYYLLSNESGSTQLICGTFEEFFSKYKAEMENFINGLDIQVK